MSLLTRGTETVVVFPAEEYQDEDGNPSSRPSAVGVVARAVVQPIKTDEDQDTGFTTESRYRLRLVGFNSLLGAQSQIEWQSRRYSIHGEARQFNGSAQTRHVDYTMVRA